MTKEEAIYELDHSNRAVNIELDKQYNSYLLGKAAAYDEAIELVKEIQEPERKWIPCSEMLPEGGKMVLVTDMVTDEVTVAFLNDFKWFQFEDGRGHNAKAWMPLPEPYKAGE